MGLYDKTDNYDNLCPSGPSGGTRSELNHILEINEAHTDNFILVIPRLPVAKYLSSYFNEVTTPKSVFSTGTSGTTATSGTSGTNSALDDICDTAAITDEQIIREENLDINNFRLYVSSVTMPDVSINSVTLGTQFADINRASKISFGDLNISALVSENFINYNVILFWLYALHNPKEYNKIFGRQMIDVFFTEIHLIITNNHREKVAEYKFIDAFPNSLTPLNFDFKTADKLNMDISWKHSGMQPCDNFVLKYV